MTDLRLTMTPSGGDLTFEDGDLALDHGLETAVVVSLLSDARAPDDPAQATPQLDRRGFWGDRPNDRWGSLLWTLERAKRLPSTAEQARETCLASLQWMIEEQIAARVEVAASFDPFGNLRFTIELARGTARRWSALWASQSPVSIDVARPEIPIPPDLPPDLNVIVILFDDGGAELFNWSGLLAPARGNVKTPNLDLFRQQGVTFLRAYANSICGPTRARVQTGRYGFRSSLGGNMDGAESIGYRLGEYGGVQTETFLAKAVRLGRDGTADQTLGQNAFTYALAWFGKGHLFSDAGQENFPITIGWGRYIGCQPNANSLEHWPFGQFAPNVTPATPTSAAANSGHFHFREIQESFGTAPIPVTYGDQNPWVPGGPNPYYTAWDQTLTPKAAWDAYKVVRDTIQWVNTRDQPVVTMICINPPHAPFEVPPYTVVDNVGVGATGATINLISPETQTAMNALNGGTGSPGYRPPSGGASDATTRAVYDASIEAVDSLLGLLVNRLDPVKRAKTVFILIGDNGTVADVVEAPYAANHAKRTIQEQGMRVPMIVWGSPLAIASPNRTTDQLTHAVDIFATVLELAQCDPEAWNPGGAITIDSRSFVPILRDPAAPPARTHIYNEIFLPLNGQLDGEPDGVPVILENQWTKCMLDGTYKLIEQSLGVVPRYKFFRIDNTLQPASGEQGYFERDADDLYPLTLDGLHHVITARFNALKSELDTLLAS